MEQKYSDQIEFSSSEKLLIVALIEEVLSVLLEENDFEYVED